VAAELDERSGAMLERRQDVEGADAAARAVRKIPSIDSTIAGR